LLQTFARRREIPAMSIRGVTAISGRHDKQRGCDEQRTA
jgi:hypothetical protein